MALGLMELVAAIGSDEVSSEPEPDLEPLGAAAAQFLLQEVCFVSGHGITRPGSIYIFLKRFSPWSR